MSADDVAVVYEYSNGSGSGYYCIGQPCVNYPGEMAVINWCDTYGNIDHHETVTVYFIYSYDCQTYAGDWCKYTQGDGGFVTLCITPGYVMPRPQTPTPPTNGVPDVPAAGGYSGSPNNDTGDQCNNDSCCGMPIWRISEPYTSLWLHDEPLGYQPAVGPRISFKLAFKQYESTSGFDTNVFSVGKRWNCPWLSYVTYNPTTPDLAWSGGQIVTVQVPNVNYTVAFPGGGQQPSILATAFSTPPTTISTTRG